MDCALVSLGRFFGLELADPAVHVGFDASALAWSEIVHAAFGGLGMAGGGRNRVSGEAHRPLCFRFPVGRCGPLDTCARISRQPQCHQKDRRSYLTHHAASITLRLNASRGRTVAESLEIAWDVARKPLEACREREDQFFVPRSFTAARLHPGDMPEGTLRAILKQAGIDPDEFLRA